MKLLFDHNLSPRLVARLRDLYPDSSHVALARLERSSDIEVWECARSGGFLIVTKDSDFSDVSVMRGFPPKIVWLRLGNCTTGAVERVLRKEAKAIQDFAADPLTGVLELFA